MSQGTSFGSSGPHFLICTPVSQGGPSILYPSPWLRVSGDQDIPHHVLSTTCVVEATLVTPCTQQSKLGAGWICGFDPTANNPALASDWTTIFLREETTIKH